MIKSETPVFVEARAKMERFAQGNPPPFIAKVDKRGTVRIWKNHRKLLKLVQQIVESQQNQDDESDR